MCSGACRAGSFCAEGALAPLPCSRGTYSTRTDLSSADQCTDAQPGYYATTGSTQQTPCSPGTIQPEPKMGSCERCSAGTFQEAEGQQTCQTCPAGFYCPEGASAALPCEGGTFSSQTGAHSNEDCTACPAGTFCFAGSTTPINCSKGTYAVSERSQLCDACPEGTYQGAEGATECETCGDGFMCPPGSSARIPASCAEGTFLRSSVTFRDQDDCEMCPVASWCPGGRTPPKPCSAGTFADVIGLAQCVDCPAGTFQSKSGASACDQCTPGSYCEAAAAAMSLCTEGRYGSAPGLRSSSECDECPAGSLCPAGSVAPTPCSPGSAQPLAGQGSCVPCAAGSYQGGSSATVCLQCAAGSYCTEGAVAAAPCTGGTYSKAAGLGSRDGCTACPAGAFCFAGVTAPTSCSRGTYAASERSQLCDACPEGKYQGAEGATVCNQCEAGFMCPEGSVVQIPASCDPGTYLNATVELCLGCPAGSVCAGGALPPRPCDRGGYCAANVSKPTECPAGSYQNLEGQTACKACVLGSYCDAGSTTPLLCPAGTYGDITGLRGIDECTDAPPDFYAQAGSTVPKACPSWGFCPGRQQDNVNDMPGSIPIVVPDGQHTQAKTEVVQQTVNQTVLQLPLQVEVDDVDALNITAIRLQVAGMLGIPLHSMSLDFGTSRRRLAHLFRARLRRLVALDFVVTIIEEPALDIATAESIWRSKNISTLSAELGMDVTDAPSPVVAKKVIVQNATVSTLVLVECGAGYWGANGQCIPCAKGTYRSGGTNSSECLECVAGTYMPFLGASECIRCGAGNYSANTLSCEPCQVGEYCVAGTQVGTRCPLAHSTTFGRGARGKDDCVCQAGYFLGNNSCEVCPGGTDCSSVGVSVASLPLLPGWWRLQNSTQIERCFATSNCTGGANINGPCGIGYEARVSTPVHPKPHILNPNPSHRALPLPLPYPYPTPIPYPYTLPLSYPYPYPYLNPTPNPGPFLWLLRGRSERHAISPLSWPMQAVRRQRGACHYCSPAGVGRAPDAGARVPSIGAQQAHASQAESKV